MKLMCIDSLRTLMSMIIVCTGFMLGCKQSTAPSTQAPEEAETEEYRPPKTAVDAQEDMIGNWVVDAVASKVAGLKDAAQSNAVFSVVMDPNGERTLYRDGQIAEKGLLQITKVNENGDIIGTFKNERGGAPIAVTIQIRGESEMAWTFEGGKRSEVLRRQQMQPEAVDGAEPTK